MIEFHKNDILYIYKIKTFNGFAPCLNNRIYSLACCKGNRRNGGMRASVCKRVQALKQQEQSVWIMAISAKYLKPKNPDYSYGLEEIVYLAKVTDTMSHRKYEEKYSITRKDDDRRLDAIYYWEDERYKQRENDFHCEEHIATDVAANITPANENKDMHQVILSDDFYVFEPGHNITEIYIEDKKKYDVNHGYKICLLNDALKEYLSKLSDDSYKHNYNPFEQNCKSESNGRCGQK